MLRRWASSASVYLFGESIGSRLDDRDIDPKRVASVVSLGATADALCLRAFHVAVESRLPSPIFRTLAEQVMYAPCSNSGYLWVTRGRWTWHDFQELYARDCTFWSIASYAGYKWVPLRVRYLYVSGASLVWNTWRSSLG